MPNKSLGISDGYRKQSFAAASGQQGEQEAQCSPRSALPLPTRLVLLGLAKELPENLWLRRAL